ncbi:MAG: hypothetical protein PHF17_00260 [Arcobacteraceae bacterium]|nr:hypothetical protein [Arcobacteraceae bacterium]
MSNFHWTNIISLNSSQNDAFEELLCQLAKKEDIQNKKKFKKVGNPDGGVECYVVLNNGYEIGFQAKWFLSTPQDTQWNQIEHSFETALQKHPNMVTYYVAIPQDRADPRIPNRSSFMEKWDDKVKKWKKFAKDTYGKEIEFIYWGSSDFITRLSEEKNAGLKSFFFGDIDLSNDWFDNQNKLAIADLDKRYTPEINVELDIVENFDALSRNERFKNKVDNFYHEFMVSYRNFLDHLYEKNEHIESSVIQLTDKINALEVLYEHIIFDGVAYIEFKQIEKLLEEIGNISYELSDTLDEINRKEIEEQKIKTSPEGYRTSTKYDSNVKNLRDYLSNLYQFKGIINSRTLMFVNNPFMILDGEAGIGKSHLLADIVNERIKENSNSIFLLGQQFKNEIHPWSQILNDLLRLNCNEAEFLGALNAKAESQNKRLIIFIDAINEGKGRDFWNEFLISFIESIKQYEWLGLVLSIRSSYFDLIVPRKIFEKGLAIPITHFGFEGVEYNASKLFFENYNILQPSIPLLHPEFSNPLLLKLFCEGLNKKGLTHVPDGYEGITNIIRFFIEGVEEKLLKKYENIKSLKLVEKVIDTLVSEMINNQIIAYDTAFEIVESISLKYRIASGLLEDLISEGLLTKNIFYENNELFEKIYFAYERFEDNLKVKYLFDNYLDKENPKESFEKKSLSTYFEGNNIFFNRGVIDAMCIQLPERASFELIDVVEQNEEIIDSFLNSLVWRKVDSITPNVIDRIMKNIDNEHFQEDIYKILFSTASNPQHPLNANLLFDYLSKFTMKDRDVFLIPLLNSIYMNYETNPIKRLIDWAWSDEDKSYISTDSILLTSIALSWLLISSNRQLRDYATKALISLLQNRVTVVLSLLKKFENITEPYIYERLFAVSLGVVIRLENYDHLKELGEYIYNTIFNKDEVYPHILLRDYAKNTIDYISYIGVTLDLDFNKIMPPYNSEFPQISELPKKEDIDKYQDRGKDYHQSRIISSMMTEYGYGQGGYGDFGRYVFESKLYDFECKKDAQLISNYATKKIFEEYGYSGEFFNDAEKAISSMKRGYDRHNHSTERIGKKYQWIAFFDTLARVTDNFKMYDASSWGDQKEEIQYQGPFEPCVRDIDPTILIKETKIDKKSNKTFWWTSKVNIDWGMDNTTWVNHVADLPNPQNILNVIDENSEEWIALNSFPDWDEPIKKGYDKYKVIHKGLWYQFRSYLVPKKELNDFKLWADKQWFWNDWMPSEKGHSQMFNREHYWSEAYKFFQNPYYGGHEDWTEIEPGYGTYAKKYAHKVALTTDQYYWEDEYDYSKEGSFSILKPSKILFDGLNMRYSKKDGEFIDKSNNLTCFEASVDNETHQCLLVKKENLLKFLNDNDLTIVWTIIGEKQIHMPLYGRHDEFFGLMQINGYAYLDNDKVENGKIQIKNMNSNHKESLIDCKIE